MNKPTLIAALPVITVGKVNPEAATTIEKLPAEPSKAQAAHKLYADEGRLNPPPPKSRGIRT